MPSKRNRDDRPTQNQIECYVKWLRLTYLKEYREASREIVRLRERVAIADERQAIASVAYQPYLDGRLLDSGDRETRQTEYWSAEESARRAQESLTKQEDETCKRFGICHWWNPEDSSIGVKEAHHIINPSYPVEVLDPPQEKRVDSNAKINKEGLRTLAREGTWVEPPRSFSKADEEGWLTLRVNTNASLEEVERAIAWHLRANRVNTPKTRHRPDKVARSIEAFICYEQFKKYSSVAKLLHRSSNTIKAQCIRAFVLIHGKPPSGSIKQRRGHIEGDPASEFQGHLGSCSRCQKADSAEGMCPKFGAFVTQDTKTSWIEA